MAALKDKIEIALEECYMLVLGAQVLVGFDYRAVFEPNFARLPILAQNMKITALGLQLLALGLLLSPVAYHRIVDSGHDKTACHRFITHMVELGMLPFALGFGCDAFIATEKLAGRAWGIVGGTATMLTALCFWYGIEYALCARRASGRSGENAAMKRSGSEARPQDQESKDEGLKDKVEHVLHEARMVLPGAQAMLGFQFAIILTGNFDKLPVGVKFVHLASLVLTMLTTVLLMTPAAYHRIVENGEDTDRFHRFASRMVIASMAFLAPSLATELSVVVFTVAHSLRLALFSGTALLVLFYSFWFGYMLYRRGLVRRSDHAMGSAPIAAE